MSSSAHVLPLGRLVQPEPPPGFPERPPPLPSSESLWSAAPRCICTKNSIEVYVAVHIDVKDEGIQTKSGRCSLPMGFPTNDHFRLYPPPPMPAVVCPLLDVYFWTDVVSHPDSMSSCRGRRTPTSRRRRRIPLTPHPRTRPLSVFTKHSSRHPPTKAPRHRPRPLYTTREANLPTMRPQVETRWLGVVIPGPLLNTIHHKPAASS